MIGIYNIIFLNTRHRKTWQEQKRPSPSLEDYLCSDGLALSNRRVVACCFLDGKFNFSLGCWVGIRAVTSIMHCGQCEQVSDTLKTTC